MDAAIITELRLTESTIGTRRNVQDLTVATNMLTATHLATDEYSLNINNAEGNATGASVSLGPVFDYVHFTCSSPVTVTLTTGGNSLSFIVQTYIAITGAFDQITLLNSSQTIPATINAFYG
jgi:hypothetical protein